ncbi:glutamate 2,3-aminomutase [Metallumcola ferriviriculae]|uniref:Glutamate 2,3-aminomutase n=1 Tax=Metallumcola ferriviriculae TaxID=3039180 RepID=A0AAU0UR89_9FIRM|nr:glutamate 2,3-aminomutase [Desulfitibacteraceae bacterium MK1]
MTNQNSGMDDKRNLAEQRAVELKSKIQPYLDAREGIPTGMKLADQYKIQKQKILKLLGGTEEDWNDWHWQVKNRFGDVEQLSKILNLSEEEKQQIAAVGERFRWAASPYYVSLMDPDDKDCPVRRQAIPSVHELQDHMGKDDPMGEEFTSPVPSITRRYPDRLIIKVTNQCAMYCRHCQRRRNIGEIDKGTPKEQLEGALEYVRNHPEIRDVLLTGGDAFMLNEEVLDWLLGELNKIEHVEVKRLGTRTLVTMPQRVTPELCNILEKHHPVYVNTHFNNPKEITQEVAEACDKLTKAGVPIGNQAVLLKGINNDPHVMKKLNHELLKVRIRPYYIFHAKPVTGTAHFITRVEEGIAIMEALRGQTSGLAIPTYIINAPNGYGKTPMLPEYLISSGKDYITIRTWEGRVMQYPNLENI